MLSGCTVVPIAAGTVSVVATGRGVSDHAISYATDQDCNMVRILNKRDICHQHRVRFDDEYTVLDDIFYWW